MRAVVVRFGLLPAVLVPIWFSGARVLTDSAGKVLSGMAKRIAPDAEALALNTAEELEAFAKSL